MKKIIKTAAVILGVILLLLLVMPLLFKSKIEGVVRDKINEQVLAEVDWEKFGLTFFRGFPELSVNLHRLSVVGVDAFAGDTLAGIRRFELRVNPFSAFSRNVKVNAILLEDPLVNGIVLAAGSANWDIAVDRVDEEEEVEPDAPVSSMKVSLKRLAVSNGRIHYTDRNSGLDASMEGFDLEMRGDLSMEETELKLHAAVDRLNAKAGGIRYLKDAVLNMELLAAANLLENHYILKENSISLNELTLVTEGEVRLREGGALDMDLAVSSGETAFKTLLSLLPAVYLQDFESVETAGSLQVAARIHGTMNDTLYPDGSLDLQVSNGYFSYPGLPGDVSDVQLSLQVDYRGANVDASVVKLDQFKFLMGGNPFEMQMQVDHPISDMHVAGRAEGIIDFSTLGDVIPLDDTELSGRLEARLRWDALMSQIEQELYEQVSLEGSLLVEGMMLESAAVPVPVALEKLSMLFNPRYVELEAFDLMLGSSDLHMQGSLENFIPYVFNNQVVSGTLTLSSSLLNANELVPSEMQPEAQVVLDTIVPAAPDSLAEALGVRIPEDIDFAMDLNMQRIEYGDLLIENLKGAMRVRGGVAGIERMEMEVAEGKIISAGWVDTRGEFAEVDFNLEMTGIDIPTAYESIVSVRKLVPMARFTRGNAHVEMQVHSLMDRTFTPLYESIDAKGDAFTSGLQFQGLEELVPLSQLLNNDKFTEMAPGEVDVGFTVREGRVIFNPFSWNIERSTFKVSGSHGIDLTMDYQVDMNIAKSDLGSGLNGLMQGMSALAAGAGLAIPQSEYIKVTGNLGGTFTKPEFTTDLSANLRGSAEGVRTSVEERINEEVKKVEEQVRDEAGEEAEKIIAEAEKEAARLLDEARKAGEALVSEAESQGEKLMKEAGNNPLKQVAARTAASELVRQAETRSDRLVSEAERAGEEAVQKAREEAGRL